MTLLKYPDAMIMSHFVAFMTTGKRGRLVKLMQEKRKSQTFRYHEKFYIVRKYNSAVLEMAKKESGLVSEIIFAVITALIVFTSRNAPCPNAVSLEKYMNHTILYELCNIIAYNNNFVL